MLKNKKSFSHFFKRRAFKCLLIGWNSNNGQRRGENIFGGFPQLRGKFRQYNQWTMLRFWQGFGYSGG